MAVVESGFDAGQSARTAKATGFYEVQKVFRPGAANSLRLSPTYPDHAARRLREDLGLELGESALQLLAVRLKE